MKSIFFMTILSGVFFVSQNASALAEFGTLHSSAPGQVVITVDDGNPIKKYCIVELTVKDKKIKWISHPLSEAFVKRDPRFLFNFNDKNLLIASLGKDKKDNINAQVHLYTKGLQTLDLLAEEECTDRAEIKVENKSVDFSCGDKSRTAKFSDESQAKLSDLLTSKPIEFKGKTYEVVNGEWRFEIAETDNYFKDRLLIVQKNQVLKEYKASDFTRCFDYETLKGSQDKFTE